MAGRTNAKHILGSCCSADSGANTLQLKGASGVTWPDRQVCVHITRELSHVDHVQDDTPHNKANSPISLSSKEIRNRYTLQALVALPNYIGVPTSEAKHLKLFQFCMQLTKAFVAETSCDQLLIDSAMYLLTINMPALKSVAMNLYNDIVLVR